MVNSDYSDSMARVDGERATVGSGSTATTTAATAVTNASASKNSSASTQVPTSFKPHRTKAELLTEIVSDNLIRFACDL